MDAGREQIGIRPPGAGRSGTILRAAVFSALLAWMAAGPFYVQVLGGRGGIARYIREWVMFSLRGMDFVEARFYRQRTDGTRIELDRFALLGYPDRGRAPLGLRRIPNQERTLHIAKELCDKLGPGADVRVVSHLATAGGWRRQYRGTEKICK
jgi:hypothetical protein